MSTRGPLCHIDLSASDPARSIAFYDVLLPALGYRRLAAGGSPYGDPLERACWTLDSDAAPAFSIEVRPAAAERRGVSHDRYAPGLHHLAFHAESRRAVDEIHARVLAAGGTVLDPPADYSREAAYSEGYYATFFADPDGVKLEVVFEPVSNPPR